MTIDGLNRGSVSDERTDHSFGRLLRSEGVNLTEANGTIPRGTPVFVERGADLVEVQRLMCEHHIRRVTVLDGDTVVFALDIVDLARETDFTT